MLLEKVKKTIRDHELFGKKEKIQVAYSGGIDSTALLHLLLELREEWSLEISLGHFNHKLRQSAEEDERFVRKIARKYSLPLHVGYADVRAEAGAKKTNIEEAGRQLRYEYLKSEAEKIGAKVATGHTLTDQAETFLMRLMRGSGLRGLAGIFPAVEGKIIRPLLEIEREEIVAYLKKKKIAFRLDESNLDRRFLRNRIRLELLPYIQKNFEPGIVSHLGKIAAIIREEDALLEEIAKKKEREAIQKKGRSASLDLVSLSSIPLALARRVVRNFIVEFRGSLRRISFEDVESVLSLAEGKEYSLKEDLILRREGSRVFLKDSAGQGPYEYQWDGEGILELRETGHRFRGKRIKNTDLSRIRFDDQTRVFLDLGKLKFPLVVRDRREGDRYRSMGAPGQKKIKEIFRAKGIPLSQRGKHPVFLSSGEIVWILGLPVSEKHKIAKYSIDIFQIEKL